MSTSSSIPNTRRDTIGYLICRTCKRRYVEPSSLYTRGEKKGQPFTNCDVCSNRVTAKNFPLELMVPDEVRRAEKNKPKQPDEAESWIASLTPEQESVLLHSSVILQSLRAETRISDLSHATRDIRWGDIEERLRDVYSLDRLFQGFTTLRAKYCTEANTVAPVGLLSVSLNNYACQNELCFKVCWLHINLNQGSEIPGYVGASATLFLALEAWSTSERSCWENATPSQRLKMCSAWSKHMQQEAESIQIPYGEVDSCYFDRDGKAYVHGRVRSCLLWAHKVYDITGRSGPGELLFPDGQQSAARLHCRTSSDLMTLLCDAFNQASHKTKWSAFQRRSLDEIQAQRDPGNVNRTIFADVVNQKRTETE